MVIILVGAVLATLALAGWIFYLLAKRYFENQQKQQLLHRQDIYEYLYSENDTVVNVYPGVHNTGIIYAATYGKGMYRCENYKQYSGLVVPETPAVTETTVEMYPNPVREQASVSFEMEADGNVSYQGRFAQGKQQININTSELSAGSYILRLSQGASSATVKFLVY